MPCHLDEIADDVTSVEPAACSSAQHQSVTIESARPSVREHFVVAFVQRFVDVGIKLLQRTRVSHPYQGRIYPPSHVDLRMQVANKSRNAEQPAQNIGAPIHLPRA